MIRPISLSLTNVNLILKKIYNILFTFPFSIMFVSITIVPTPSCHIILQKSTNVLFLGADLEKNIVMVHKYTFQMLWTKLTSILQSPILKQKPQKLFTQCFNSNLNKMHIYGNHCPIWMKDIKHIMTHPVMRCICFPQNSPETNINIFFLKMVLYRCISKYLKGQSHFI